MRLITTLTLQHGGKLASLRAIVLFCAACEYGVQTSKGLLIGTKMTLILCIMLAFAVLVLSCVLAHVLNLLTAPQVAQHTPQSLAAAKEVDRTLKAGETVSAELAKAALPSAKPKPASSQWVGIKNELEREVSE